MAQIKGTNVVAPVVPLDTADVHPSHEARYGKGGYRTVATTTERDAIPAPRREAGMLVYVAASGGSLWQLGSDLTTWTAFETGGGAPDAHAASHGQGGSDAVTVAIGQVTGLQTALDGKQATGTYATLVGGKVPAEQLPSYVDDVLEYANLAALPGTGATGVIYVALDTNKVYRWSGSAYVEVSPGATAWSDITGKPSTFTPSSHTHATSDITGLDATLQGIDSAISGKADSTHASQHATGGADEIAGLLDNWGIEWDEGVSETGAYLAGTLVRSVGSLYVLQAANSDGIYPGDALWPELTQVVVSVAGKSGVVTLGPSDVGAAAVSHAHSATDVTSGTFDIARIPTGTTSTTVSLGNHTHAQLHDRSHAITSSSDHTATAWRAFYSNGSGVVTELALGASGTVLTSGGASAAPTFSALPAGGTKSIIRFYPGDNQPPASNFATLDTRNSVLVLEFDAATDESAVFTGYIPEGATLTNGLKVRISWMADTATSGNVRWGVQFEADGTDLDADSYDTATLVTSAANGTSGIETVAEITATTIDSLAAGDRFRLKVYRDADDATNDTMTGDAQLVAVEVQVA